MVATHPVVKIKSRRSPLSAVICQRTESPHRDWRADDPPSITVGDLNADHIGHRVVIRAKDFLGTITGVLVGVRQHPALTQFAIVQLHERKAITLRRDMEVIVVN